MKRLLPILFLAVVFAATSVAANAQAVVPITATKATLTNADTAFLNFLPDDQTQSVQVVVNRLTGTAAGKAILRASNDGVNFIAVGADTLTFTNAAVNTKFWTVSPLRFAHYRVEVITSGTVTANTKGYLVRRKSQ